MGRRRRLHCNGWLLAVWLPGAGAARLKMVTDRIRAGCQQSCYWLRAYAATPEKIAVLFYPLADVEATLERLSVLAGAAPLRVRTIEDDADLERAARYVEALPVRAHLAERPEEYPLSSLGWLTSARLPAPSHPKGLARRARV